MSKRVDFLVKKLEFIVKKSWIVQQSLNKGETGRNRKVKHGKTRLSTEKIVKTHRFSCQKVRIHCQKKLDCTRGLSPNKVAGDLFPEVRFTNFICPFFCPLDFQALRRLYQNQLGFKRKTGLGPATSTLARWSSTTELLSHFRRTSLEVCPVCERRDLNPHIRDTRT